MSAPEDEEAPCLVTNYCFEGRDYLIKMFARNNQLKLSIIDSTTSEKWVCTYNSMYIEELTRRTGNYKKFSIFVTMLKSGILRTSSSVRIELMSHRDLEVLSEKTRYQSRYNVQTNPSTEQDTLKYVILIYTVEFDKIHYPLPLEYCGMPNPKVLQKRIQYLEKEKLRLENELSSAVCTKCNTQLPALLERINTLTEENRYLEEELKSLATELENRQHRLMVADRKPYQDENHAMKMKLRQIQRENHELRNTVDVMGKKLNKSAALNHQSHSTARKCEKCAITRKPQLPPKKLLTTRSLSPSVQQVTRKASGNDSTRSSLSSANKRQNSTINGRTRIRRKLRNCTKSDGNHSSSSAGERNTTGKTPPSRSALLGAAGDQRSSKEVLSADELKKQIQDLMRVVESWSHNLYSSIQK